MFVLLKLLLYVASLLLSARCASTDNGTPSISHTGPGSKARVALLLVTILMFLCSTALWALDVADLILKIKACWIDNLDLPLTDRVSVGNNLTVLFDWIQNILYSFEVRLLPHFGHTRAHVLILHSKFVLGDCIVVWRACVLAQDIPKLWVVLTTLLMGSLGEFALFQAKTGPLQ